MLVDENKRFLLSIVISVPRDWLQTIYSLSAHIDELRLLLSDRPIDILAMNETKLDDTTSDNEIHISGYESIRSDRSTNGRSAGSVCFFLFVPTSFILFALT